MGVVDLTQQEVMAFLASPEAYGPGCSRVDRFDTHISVVYLTDDRASKLKRAVRYSYPDCSTLEARRHFCEKEVRLNWRTAPALYRRAVPVTRAADGSLQIDGAGTPVEWLVEMRRFDQDRRLDIVAERGALDVPLAAAIGAAAAQLPLSADSRQDHGGAAAMQWVMDENDAELSPAGEVISQPLRPQIYRAALDGLRRYGQLLPLFLSCRTAIRAKVLNATRTVSLEAAEADRLGQEAARYLALAQRLTAPATRGIIAIRGLNGSGKSTLARLLAPALGQPPGAVVLRRDVARKRRFGVDPAVRLPDVADEAPVSAAVYHKLADCARHAARAGYVTLVDAVFPTEALRRAIRDAAARDGAPFRGIWLDASAEVMEHQLAAQSADASDATVAVLRQQQAAVEAQITGDRLDASAELDQLVQAARSRIGEHLFVHPAETGP